MKESYEYNKQKRSRFETIQMNKYSETNKYMDEQPQHNIEFNLIEPNEKDGTFVSQ